MKKTNKILLLLLVLLVIGTSCKKIDSSAGSTAEAPENINTTFILFEEEDNIEARSVDGMSIGSLYIKKENEEIELIAKDVFDSAVYDNETEEVIYIDDEYNLYNFKSPDEKAELIDKNVSTMYFTDTEDKKIVYTTEDNSVYVYNNSETEKIGSNVKQFKVIGDDVYYNTQDNYLIIYNIATREEKRIANDVENFKLLDNKNKIIYLSDSHSLYYLDNLDEDSIKISSGPVSLNEVIIVDEKIYFSEYKDDAYELYLGDLSGETRPEKITDDVEEFKIYKNDIYYLTSDSILYKLQDKDKSKRIAVDVVEFDLGPSQSIFLDKEGSLHTWNPDKDESSVIGHEVESYEMFTNGEVYYLNNEKELFKNNTKLASDINYYSAFYNTLAYADTESLYLISDSEEDVIIEDSLDDYSVIYYQNYPVYENRLTLSDISGFWKFTDEEEKEYYFEIRSNGVMTSYNVDSEKIETQLEVLYSGFNKLELNDENSGDYLVVRQDDEGTRLEINEEDNYKLTKSSRDEFNEYAKNYKKEKKEAEIQEQKNEKASVAEYVVEGFIMNMPDAVNYGEFYMISQYIDPSSSFYDEQSKFVWNLYEKNITEYLHDYEIINSKMNEDQSITIETREVFDVYNYEKNTEERVTYRASYALKKVNDEYLIYSLSTN